MKKMTIAKLAALMAVLTTGAAQAAVSDLNAQSVDVTFTDSAVLYHTLKQNGPFATGSADALAHPIVAIGAVTSSSASPIAIQWGNTGSEACQAGETTTCTIKNEQGQNAMVFKLEQQGGAELPTAGVTDDGWYGRATGQLNYNIKLDSGTMASGSYRLTVSAASYSA